MGIAAVTLDDTRPAGQETLERIRRVDRHVASLEITSGCETDPAKADRGRQGTPVTGRGLVSVGAIEGLPCAVVICHPKSERRVKEMTVTHPNEERLRDLYAVFAKGDLPGFLAGCTDDVTFAVPGNTPGSGTFTKDNFVEWITTVLGQTAGTFQEHVLDVFANDEHGILMLHHEFDRDGDHRQYLTAHAVQLRNGRISAWEERPGSMAEFDAAWGTR